MNTISILSRFLNGETHVGELFVSDEEIHIEVVSPDTLCLEADGEKNVITFPPIMFELAASQDETPRFTYELNEFGEVTIIDREKPDHPIRTTRDVLEMILGDVIAGKDGFKTPEQYELMRSKYQGALDALDGEPINNA